MVSITKRKSEKESKRGSGRYFLTSTNYTHNSITHTKRECRSFIRAKIQENFRLSSSIFCLTVSSHTLSFCLLEFVNVTLEVLHVKRVSGILFLCLVFVLRAVASDLAGGTFSFDDSVDRSCAAIAFEV